MYVLDIVVPDGRDPGPVVERLETGLDPSGRVAVLRRDAAVEVSDHTVVRVGEDGWRATGRAPPDVTDVLDDLARDHAYALTVGFPDAGFPLLAVGDADVDEPLARVDDAAALDVDAVADALLGTEPYESLPSLVARAKRSSDATFSGAIATFTGRVRTKEDPTDAPTEALTFEKYDGVAEDRLEAIRRELEAREGVFEVLFHHRTGRVEAGGDVVFVVVLAGHRREAFDTVEDGIDRLKAEVPLFKKELTVDEEFWVHDREA